MRKFTKTFFQSESSAGLFLFLATVAAILVANSSLGEAYHALLATPIGFLSVEGWVNDGLMAIFFFVVGMEIKSELTDGELASFDRALLPVVGALGGMIVPALVYLSFVQDRGWGIPMATDIAFAVGVLTLCGRRLSPQLKVFLLALAIADDLGAVLVIALFYTEKISVPFLLGACGIGAALWVLRQARVRAIWVYLPLGLLFWFCVHQSGVHAAVAGAVMGFMVRNPRRWISRLHAASSFVVMPIFAFVNAGLSFADVSMTEVMTNRLVSAISYGLLLGKPLGIFGASWLAVRLGFARLSFRWRELLGVACLGGIGFSVSLFIAGLALKDPRSHELAKIGIVKGSLLSGILGCLVLLIFRAPKAKA